MDEWSQTELEQEFLLLTSYLTTQTHGDRMCANSRCYITKLLVGIPALIITTPTDFARCCQAGFSNHGSQQLGRKERLPNAHGQ